MTSICKLDPINLSESTTIDNPVEHRRIFNLKNCELNIFETFHKCDNVVLSHDGLVISSMMRGKKLMTVSRSEKFDFLPGESVIVPEEVTMKVDFPEADEKHPVQCATLSLNWDMVGKNLEFLNDHYPNTAAPFEWKLNFEHYHFVNNKELASSLNKLISISMEESEAKDALADLSLKFLLLRIIQTQNLATLNHKKSISGNFAPAIQYIHENLTEKISIEKLTKLVCMSKTMFFNAFKDQYGITPLDYIIKERITRAKNILADHNISITEACYMSGFNNVNYFIRIFKRLEGITPRNFRG